MVTLTPTTAAGSTFLGWSGGGCTGTGPCTLTVTSAINTSAAFARDQTLVVTTSGFGTGTVSSSPAGIDCGTDCSQVYAGNTIVTLTAVADATSTFAGWTGGGCVGTGPCTVNVNNAILVNAQFDSASISLDCRSAPAPAPAWCRRCRPASTAARTAARPTPPAPRSR
jgi:hypothetical protein